MSQAEIFDEGRCYLGEGPLWHPGTGTLFWFDIIAGTLHARTGTRSRSWEFGEPASAAGWIGETELLVATASGLRRFDLASGRGDLLVPFPGGAVPLRPNDGRADPAGGFWIGTMGLKAEPGAGAIYRYAGGELRRLHDGISIPNSIAFAPDGTAAYFADTPTRRIMRQPLDADGWPAGDPAVFVDLSGEGLNPDGSVVDADGCLWNAQWGAGRVARYTPDGRFERAVKIPASNASCPAFGGADLATLYVTSAREGLSNDDLKSQPLAGAVFSVAAGVRGLPEPGVKP